MPRLGMTGRWPGFAPPAVALLVTLLLTWLTVLTGSRGIDPSPVSGALLLILLPAPLLVAVMWGAAVLTGRPHRLAPIAAVAGFAAGSVLWPQEVLWPLFSHVVAGLLAGLALGSRWRLDAAVLVIALALTPVLVWSTLELSPREQFQVLSDEMLRAAEKNLPATADETQRALALANEKRNLERVSEIGLKVFPFMLAIGVLGQATIVLAGLWLVIRGLGMRPHRWRLPPFTRWRMPFYVVWLLIAGIGLTVTRRPGWSEAGLNLALLAAFVLSVQGIAIQFFVTGRMMSNLGRLVYWAVMGIFFGPLVLVSGVVLGLVDQWWDIRRLQAAEPDDDNDDDTDNDGESEIDSGRDRGEGPADRFPQD